jgi:uncharacterized protein YqgV (UPF0045/DUF77 family)
MKTTPTSTHLEAQTNEIAANLKAIEEASD